MRGARQACALRDVAGSLGFTSRIGTDPIVGGLYCETGRPALEGARDAVSDTRAATRGTKLAIVVRVQVDSALLEGRRHGL